MITMNRLARILAEEFSRDGWGDIEPHWFKLVADECNETEPDAAEAEAMADVLQRVAARLNEEAA
jgi:hypothetical protein